MGPLSLFTLAPGLPAPWEVVDVAFDPQSGRIDFHRAFAPGTRLNCFQFQACIHAKVSRVRCETCAKDAVRRQEVKRAPERRRTRCIWLQDKHAWSNRQKARFAELKRRNLKTHRGFRFQETLHRRYSWMRRCRPEPIKAVAKTLKKHWPSLPMRSIPGSPTAVSRRSICSSRPPKPGPAATGPPGT